MSLVFCFLLSHLLMKSPFTLIDTLHSWGRDHSFQFCIFSATKLAFSSFTFPKMCTIHDTQRSELAGEEEMTHHSFLSPPNRTSPSLSRLSFRKREKEKQLVIIYEAGTYHTTGQHGKENSSLADEVEEGERTTDKKKERRWECLMISRASLGGSWMVRHHEVSRKRVCDDVREELFLLFLLLLFPSKLRGRKEDEVVDSHKSRLR